VIVRFVVDQDAGETASDIGERLMMENDEGPTRTTKVFAHSRTVFPGGGKDPAAVIEFCKAAKIAGKVVVNMAGNGGITNIVFEATEVEVDEGEDSSLGS
jgi:hypothetical protein